MEPIDPRVHPSLLPPGCRALVVAEHQDEYLNLPSIVTPDARVITRWQLTDHERVALLDGADVYLTIWGVPIRPVFLSVGPCDWTGVSVPEETAG
jgi:hypothetical protein